MKPPTNVAEGISKAEKEMLKRVSERMNKEEKRDGIAASMNASPRVSLAIKQDMSNATRINETDPRYSSRPSRH